MDMFKAMKVLFGLSAFFSKQTVSPFVGRHSFNTETFSISISWSKELIQYCFEFLLNFLPHSNDVDLSKFEASIDNDLNVTQLMECLSGRVEIIV